jgi:diaminopimelate decarboxylase
VSAPLPRHAELTEFLVEDDCLIVGGLSLSKLVECLGGTPIYIYDHRIIDRRIELLRGCLPKKVKLHYAIKANPMPAVVAHLAQRVDGLDVASAGELRVALDAGMNPHEISFAGPGKTDAEIKQGVVAGVLFNVESARELQVLAQAMREMSQAPRVAIRVNPDFELKSSGMKMGGGPKQFGVDAERVPQLLAEVRALGLTFEGFHIFWGSQNLSAAAICEAQRKSFELALGLARHASAPIRVLNIGGGFGIPYFPGERPLDIGPIGENLAKLVERAADDLPHAELVVELGRYLVGEAGIYVCRVIDRKISRGHVFLVTDGGLHQNLAASGNFGQVIRKNYPVVIGDKVYGGRREIASVVGPLCTPLDLLADRMELAEGHPGDLVVVFQSGAYGLTASPVAFLGHPPPREVLI